MKNIDIKKQTENFHFQIVIGYAVLGLVVHTVASQILVKLLPVFEFIMALGLVNIMLISNHGFIVKKVGRDFEILVILFEGTLVLVGVIMMVAMYTQFAKGVI